MFLAIDTATDYGSVAVGEPGAVGSEHKLEKRRHAADLMPTAVKALSEVGRHFGDLTGIVVADGPGSFTGLRIGLSTAKGILRECPSVQLLTAPSLLGLAYGARRMADGPIAALYDALRGDVFGAVYRFQSGSVTCELAPTLGTVDELRDRCPVVPALVVGDGALLHRQRSREWSGREPLGPPDLVPSAAFLIDLVAVEGATTRVGDPTSFQPEYGRLAEAQVRMEAAKGD
jgi:tRNA threonylcarbamoyl adenosine modification protein YeaZ